MLKRLITHVCLTLGLSMLLLHLFQRHFIYFPTQSIPTLEKYHATDMRIVSFQTYDDVHLSSWYKPASHHQETVLILHGNAGHVGDRMPLARQFIQAGYGVLLLEYRGYGGNEGSPSELGLYWDGQAALHFLYQQGVKPNQVVLYGESLGTGVATELATEHPVCAVILQSPFTSLVDLARYHYPWILVSLRDPFNSLGRMKQIHSPILVLHGKRDQTVPFTEGVAIFNQANDPKKMVVFDEQNHNDLWRAPGFFEKIIHFLNAHGCVEARRTDNVVFL
jgi:fermentation-respiration switch protein FrsA (DUF1100 family)